MYRSLVSIFVLAILGATVPAQAQTTIYSTGFENPPLANGSQLVGQDGWTTDAPFLNPGAGLISTAAARTGNQGFQVRGADMTTDPNVDPFYAVGVYRHPMSYGANGATTIVSADVRVDGPAGFGGPTSFFGATLASRISGPQGHDAYEFQISSEGGFFAVDDNLLNGPTIGVQGILSPHHADLNRWYHMAIATDFSAKTVTFLVDGASLGAISFDDPTYDTQSRGSLLVLTTGDQGGFSPLNYTAKFDNFAVAAVPEPGTVCLGFVMIVCRATFLRRRRL